MITNTIIAAVLVTLGYQGMQGSPENSNKNATSPTSEETNVSQQIDSQQLNQHNSDHWFSFDFDDDVIAPHNLDKNYTYGVTVTEHGDKSRSRYVTPSIGCIPKLNPHALLTWIDGETGINPYFSIGVTGFTPSSVSKKNLVPSNNDRPYSSVFYVSAGHAYYKSKTEDSIIQNSLVLGVIGSDAAKFWQDGIHDDFGIGRFQGWDSQISHPGELTADYNHSRCWGVGRYISAGYTTSIGFQTDAGGDISFSSKEGNACELGPSTGDFRPKLLQHLQQRQPEVKEFGILHYFGSIGIRGVAYNALLQGQFRHNQYEIASKDVKRVVPTAYLGADFMIFGEEFQYMLAYKGEEMKNSTSGEHYWGRITYVKDF